MDLKLIINGAEKPHPLAPESSLAELLEHLRNQYNSDSSCISLIRVDGQELSERDEAAIALLHLSSLRAVEISTAHPRELVQETLQDLIGFMGQLSNLSTHAAERFRSSGHPSRELARLFDGIHIFTEAIENSKRVLNISSKMPGFEIILVLETDLLSIAQDTLGAYGSDNREYLADLLEKHLTENLAQWAAKGIPLLIRSRDS